MSRHISAKGYRRSFCLSAWSERVGGYQLANAPNSQPFSVAEEVWDLYFCCGFRASVSADGLSISSQVSPEKKAELKYSSSSPCQPQTFTTTICGDWSWINRYCLSCYGQFWFSALLLEEAELKERRINMYCVEPAPQTDPSYRDSVQ